MMKKRNPYIRVIAGITACVLVIGILWFMNSIYSNPISKHNAEQKIMEYAKQQHDDLAEFDNKGVSYNPKLGNYAVAFTYKKQPLITFSISLTSSGSIEDGYRFDYLEANNAWIGYALDYYRTFDEKLKSTCDEVYGVCSAEVLDNEITQQEKQAFYENKNINQLKIITLSGTVQLHDTHDTSAVAKQFQTFADVFKDKTNRVKSYTLSILDEAGNSGYTVNNVSLEVMKDPSFSVMLTKALEEPEKYHHDKGFYIEMIEAK